MDTTNLEKKATADVSDLKLTELVRCEFIKIPQFAPKKVDTTVHYFDLNENETTELLLMYRSKVMKSFLYGGI